MLGGLLLVFVPGLGEDTIARAQSTTTVTQAATSCTAATLTYIGSEKVVNMATPRPVNLAECNDPAGVEVQIQLPSAASLQDQRLFAYVDITDNNQACSTGALRYDGDSTTDEPCVSIFSDTLQGSETVRTINVPIRAACPGGYDDDVYGISGLTRTLWLLQLNSETQTTASACYSVSIDFDTLAPDPPEGLNDKVVAETQFKLSWDAVDDVSVQSYHILLANAEGNPDGSDPICSSAALEALEEIDALDDLPDGVWDAGEVTYSNDPEFSLNHPDFDGEYGAAAVVALDAAGNVSEPSDIACLRRTESCGFGDACAEGIETPSDDDDSDLIGFGDFEDVSAAAGSESEDGCVDCEGFDGGGASGCSISTPNSRYVAGALPFLFVVAGLLLRSRRRIS